MGETIGEARSFCQQVADRAVPGLFVDSRLNATGEEYITPQKIRNKPLAK